MQEEGVGDDQSAYRSDQVGGQLDGVDESLAGGHPAHDFLKGRLVAAVGAADSLLSLEDGAFPEENVPDVARVRLSPDADVA